MYEISNKIRGLRPSAIREILKNMNDPEMISFAGGNPAVECFPIDAIRHYSDQLLAEQPVRMLLYSTTEGIPALRQSALAFANRYGQISRPEDDIAILTGSQQAMDFIARLLCNEGDTVVAEDPSFVGALNSFRASGAKTVGVPMEEDGVDLAKLEEAFAAKPRPKLFYVIPNFQNPTGLVTSAAKRRAIYELAAKYDIPVLEDNPYGELRFEGEYIPPIKSYDEKGLVLYCGSFSKILAPGMRLAYVIANRALIEKIVTIKQCSDTHTNTWSQMVCDAWLRGSDAGFSVSTVCWEDGEAEEEAEEESPVTTISGFPRFPSWRIQVRSCRVCGELVWTWSVAEKKRAWDRSSADYFFLIKIPVFFGTTIEEARHSTIDFISG